jgi:hypothetical protein
MGTSGVKRLVWVWLGLVFATIASLFISKDTATIGSLAGLGAITIAYIKVRFVLREFMELNHAPNWMAYLADTWVLASVILLCSLYLLGGAR